MWRRVGGPGILLLSSVLTGGCAPHEVVLPGGSAAAPQRGVVERQMSVHAHVLTLHVVPADQARPRALLVYATGDGGWRGKDREVFTQMASWGYAVVGFSAPQYLAHLPGAAGTTTPVGLAADYAAIVDEGRRALHLDQGVPAILVGVSRGADLAVAAAGQPRLQPWLGGVVAMALTREEEYVHRRRRPGVALELYTYLPRLGALPVTVIQSTQDNYLNAHDARALFGPDTSRRAFHAIDATNHSFKGARPALYRTLRDALAWTEARMPPVGDRP